jgi:type II secretory pathway pseudopilin PulG
VKSLQTKSKKGITLVALIVTIIILLILAGITITQLTESGLFAKTQLAKETQENAQIKENSTLEDYENAIGEYINGNRDTVSNMTSPILLMTASLPSSESSTRNAGTYRASNTSYTKTNGNAFTDYLTFTQDTGWTINRSGWYYIEYIDSQTYTNSNGRVYRSSPSQ